MVVVHIGLVLWRGLGSRALLSAAGWFWSFFFHFLGLRIFVRFSFQTLAFFFLFASLLSRESRSLFLLLKCNDRLLELWRTLTRRLLQNFLKLRNVAEYSLPHPLGHMLGQLSLQ